MFWNDPTYSVSNEKLLHDRRRQEAGEPAGDGELNRSELFAWKKLIQINLTKSDKSINKR